VVVMPLDQGEPEEPEAGELVVLDQQMTILLVEQILAAAAVALVDSLWLKPEKMVVLVL